VASDTTSNRSTPEFAPPAGASVIVGMSGGVDSSVAALLLKQQGYSVRGLFMKNWDEDDGTEYCTAKDDLADAQRVAEVLDIPLHTANFAAEYWDNVFEYFLAEYAAGRTPNPDVLCNREIKFKQFLDYAGVLGADCIATGHYVRGGWRAGAYELRKGIDPEKDQSYFLQAVPTAGLSRCLFPLGELHKTQVREIAEDAGFHNHRKKDSTGICFIGERRFGDFLARYLPKTPGPIRDMQGITIGEHSGLAYYTLGQRQGLGIGGTRGRQELPWYVAGKRMLHNELRVTQNSSDLSSRWLAASEVNWLHPEPASPFNCTAKVRYRQPDQACEISKRADGGYLARFRDPQRAVTPGQYVCLYNGDVCLGGGLIQVAGD
jgi:tRNA-specific 2-thiouridylase